MKLHPSVVEKILYLCKTYGGFSDERKLKEYVQALDLTVYERKTTTNQEMILVLTEEYIKQLNQK